MHVLGLMDNNNTVLIENNSWQLTHIEQSFKSIISSNYIYAVKYSEVVKGRDVILFITVRMIKKKYYYFIKMYYLCIKYELGSKEKDWTP